MGSSTGSGGGGSSGGSSGSSAGGNTLASIGLSAYATMLQAEGTATSDDFQAKKAQVAAEYGGLKADQTNATMSRNLATTLGNIDAVRAAARTDPTSPTGAAMRDNQEDIGTQQRVTTVSNILDQVQQDKADATYYQHASSSALLAGEIGMGAGILKGLSGMGSAGGGGS